MKRITASLILILSLALPSLAQDWVVTPGSGVGTIKVGMGPSAIKSVLKPTRTLGSARDPALIEYGKDFVVEYDAKKAVMISLHSNSFTTLNGQVSLVPYKGAAIGTSWATVVTRIVGRKVSRKLPTAKSQPPETYHAYPDLGVGFRVKGGKIARVDVWKN